MKKAPVWCKYIYTCTQNTHIHIGLYVQEQFLEGYKGNFIVVTSTEWDEGIGRKRKNFHVLLLALRNNFHFLPSAGTNSNLFKIIKNKRVLNNSTLTLSGQNLFDY